MNKNENNQRETIDRRTRPTPLLSRYTFFGRRKKVRRLTDPQKNYYVDRIGTLYFFAIIIIFILSIIDSVFTIYHLKHGYAEINPILAKFVFNNLYFILIKYFFTIIGIVLLVLHKYFTGVRELVIFLIVLYTALDIYQIIIYFN
jgi:hypothetical protein